MHDDPTSPWEDWLLKPFRMAQTDPRREAYQYIFTQAIETDMNYLETPEMDDGARHFAAGRVAAIRELYREFQGIIAEANKHSEEATDSCPH